MAVVQGIKEKVHTPIYDSLRVEAEQQLGEVERSNIFKFFINVQNKTKLETNLQSASLLPHYNTFEARAMRVVISDLSPRFSPEVFVSETEFTVTDDDDFAFDINGRLETDIAPLTLDALLADIEDMPLDRAVEFLKEARDSEDGYVAIPVDEEFVTITNFTADTTDPDLPQTEEEVADEGAVIFVSARELEDMIAELEERRRPLREQFIPNNGAGNILSKLIYNSVTTFYVGEKIMIQMPTWFFPAGAGPYAESGKVVTHGEPSPQATFRFAEPIYIDKQQNFRVELEVPDGDLAKEVQRIYGPLFIWIVLDGYMTRDVQ